MTAPNFPGTVISKPKMVAGQTEHTATPFPSTVLTTVSATAIMAFTVFIEGIIVILLKKSNNLFNNVKKMTIFARHCHDYNLNNYKNNAKQRNRNFYGRPADSCQHFLPLVLGSDPLL